MLRVRVNSLRVVNLLRVVFLVPRGPLGGDEYGEKRNFGRGTSNSGPEMCTKHPKPQETKH